jgi:hypothetical protein
MSATLVSTTNQRGLYSLRGVLLAADRIVTITVTMGSNEVLATRQVTVPIGRNSVGNINFDVTE